MKTITIARRIELRFNSENNEDKNAFYDDLRRWQKICQKSANMMSSHLFVMLQTEDFSYLSEFGKRKLMDENLFKDMDKEEKTKFIKAQNKEIYKVINKEQEEMFSGAIQNSYYQLLSNRYLGECPSAILSSLALTLFKTFKAEKIDYINGTKSLRSYREDIPIPIPSSLIIHVRKHVYEGKETKDFSFVLKKHPVRTNFGRDLSNNHYLMSEAFSSYFLPSWVHAAEKALSDAIVSSNTPSLISLAHTDDRVYRVEKILDSDMYQISTQENEEAVVFKMIPQKYTIKDNEGNSVVDEKGKKAKGVRYIITDNIKLCDSSILLKKEQIENKDGRKKNVTKVFLSAVLQMEKKKVILNEENVAQVYLSPDVPLTVTIGNKVFNIGSKDDFLYRRLGIQGAYRTVQRDLRFEGGGRGRKRKMKGIERYKDYERNVVNGKIHNYTKKLIDYCLEYKCKYIYLLNVERTKEEAKENPFIMRNYSVGSFSSHIADKASRIDIEVIIAKEKDSATENETEVI